MRRIQYEFRTFRLYIIEKKWYNYNNIKLDRNQRRNGGYHTKSKSNLRFLLPSIQPILLLGQLRRIQKTSPLAAKY